MSEKTKILSLQEKNEQINNKIKDKTENISSNKEQIKTLKKEAAKIQKELLKAEVEELLLLIKGKNISVSDVKTAIESGIIAPKQEESSPQKVSPVTLFEPETISSLSDNVSESEELE